MNFSRTKLGHGRSCSQKRIMRLHVVGIIWYMYFGYTAKGYAHQLCTSSRGRFLFECSSESTSGAGYPIFISSPLRSSGISSRLVYIQVRPRLQIYDSVYRIAVVSCGRKKFEIRSRPGYQNGNQIRCKIFKRIKTIVSLRIQD